MQFYCLSVCLAICLFTYFYFFIYFTFYFLFFISSCTIHTPPTYPFPSIHSSSVSPQKGACLPRELTNHSISSWGRTNLLCQHRDWKRHPSMGSSFPKALTESEASHHPTTWVPKTDHSTQLSPTCKGICPK